MSLRLLASCWRANDSSLVRSLRFEDFNFEAFENRTKDRPYPLTIKTKVEEYL